LTLGLILAAAVLAGFIIVTWNGLTRLRQLARNAWADIDVQLKRRHDLVPNLVKVVQGHAGYERGTLEAVVEARNRALAAAGPAAAGEAERALAGQVGHLLALAEAYPDLKAQEASSCSAPWSRSRIISRTPAATTTRCPRPQHEDRALPDQSVGGPSDSRGRNSSGWRIGQRQVPR
jgi:hypothetical protein